MRANDKPQAQTDSGVDDVRPVREKIAATYQGDLRRHVAETAQLVEPLMESLGVKRGVPPRRDRKQSGTGT